MTQFELIRIDSTGGNFKISGRLDENITKETGSKVQDSTFEIRLNFDPKSKTGNPPIASRLRRPDLRKSSAFPGGSSMNPSGSAAFWPLAAQPLVFIWLPRKSRAFPHIRAASRKTFGKPDFGSRISGSTQSKIHNPKPIILRSPAPPAPGCAEKLGFSGWLFIRYQRLRRILAGDPSFETQKSIRSIPNTTFRRLPKHFGKAIIFT